MIFLMAVILAGGFGNRLKSVVSTVPKPLAPIADGKCFLDILFEKLISAGCKDFIFCLHYMHWLIKERYGDGERLGVNIEYSVEETPLGTGGAIGLLRDSLAERFIVLNADTYININYERFVSEHIKKNALISIALTYVNDTERYGFIQHDDRMNITGFLEKGQKTGGFINAGVYLFEPEVFKFIPENNSSLERDVFPSVLKVGGLISGYCDTSDFADIGIPEDYQQFIKFFAATIKQNKVK